MDDKETAALLWRQINAARDAGPDPDQLRRAMDYYFGRPRGDEVPGRSQVQSLDVADMTEAVLAQVLPSFTQDSVCIFEPEGPQDDDRARLESDAVNTVLMEQNRGYTVFHDAIKNALLLKNGICKVYLDTEGDRRMVRVENVDPLTFMVGSNQQGLSFTGYGSSFCAERKCYTRGELVEMGFDAETVALIPEGGEDGEGGENLESVRDKQGTNWTPADAGWSNTEVVVYECYAPLPDDQDSSTTDLYRVLIGGQIILSKERVEYVPYAAGTAFPMPHRFWGLSLYDRLKTTQDAKTAALRQWLDNLSNCNNSRDVINDRISGEDAGDSRPGKKLRAKGMGPVQEAIMPLPVIDVGPAAISFLQYQDQVRADRAGSALQMASAESQLTAGAIGSQGVDRIFSVQEQMAARIARTLAETLIRSTFLLVHRVLREEFAEPLTLPLADQWVEVDPSQWPVRTRVNVRSGLSPGERSRKAAAMTQVLQMQQMAMQMGLSGALVAAPELYTALLDWGASLELDGTQKYFIDPRSQRAQVAVAQQSQAQRQVQGMQLQLAQMELQLEAQKLQLDKYKTDTENRIKVWTEQLHAEIEEAKIVGAAATDLQRIQAEGAQALAGGNGGDGGRAGTGDS